MKATTLLIFLLAVLVNWTAKSQNEQFTFGVKGGANISKFSGEVLMTYYQY